MLDWILVILIVCFFLGLGYLLSIQSQRKFDSVYKPSPKPPTEVMDFGPMEDRVVPTHASYSNKFNDVIGNANSGIIGPGVREVVVASDWYMSRTLPTEFDGPYWPRGSIETDFIYPGSDPKRPLRSQSLYASQTMLP